MIPSQPIPRERPVWLVIAMQELGVREVPGPAYNPRIAEYHQAAELRRPGGFSIRHLGDETPWCSSFVNFCMDKAGYEPTRSKLARSWLKWGDQIFEPREGCIVILSRGPAQLGLGHVGFFHSRPGGLVRLLGGNQGNRVSIAGYDQSRVIGYRWPKPGSRRGDSVT